MTTLEILNQFVTAKKLDLERNDYSMENRQDFYNMLGNKTRDELMNTVPIERLLPIMFKDELLNKQFEIGDFTVIIQYDISGNNDVRDGRMCFITAIRQWNVIIRYHGVYLLLYKYALTNTFEINEEVGNRYGYRRGTSLRQYEGYALTRILLSNLDISTLELVDQELDLADANPLYLKEKAGLKGYSGNGNKTTIEQYTAKEIDFKWFVTSETKKGVYTPEPVTIKRLLFAYKPKYALKPNDTNGVVLPKNLLHELGITKVQLRSDAHFDLEELFDINGITIKAPAKVIETYGYQRQCEDKGMLARIEQEQQAAQRDRKLAKYNREFTLVQHGKTLLEDVDLDKIIAYFESFVSNKENFEDKLISEAKKIFDAYPDLTKLEIANWGTYHKYESRGEQYFSDECLNSHIDEDTLAVIEKLYDIPQVDEKVVEIKYGRESQGGTMLSVQKDKKGKLKLVTEPYDPE